MQAGLWTVPAAMGGIAGAIMAPVAVRKIHPAFVISAALAIGAVGFTVLTQVVASDGLATVVAGNVIASFAVGLVTSLTTDLIIGAAPPERAGSASGISETGDELGIALGIAALGSIGVAAYRTYVADSSLTGLPPEATEAASDSLSGALETARSLPGPMGSELLDVSREAFTQGLQVNAVIGIVIAVGLAILSATMLRQVPATSDEDDTSY